MSRRDPESQHIQSGSRHESDSGSGAGARQVEAERRGLRADESGQQVPSCLADDIYSGSAVCIFSIYFWNESEESENKPQVHVDSNVSTAAGLEHVILYTPSMIQASELPRSFNVFLYSFHSSSLVMEVSWRFWL